MHKWARMASRSQVEAKINGTFQLYLAAETIAPKNGSVEYYLATATVIPILLIPYLFSMNTWGSLEKLWERNAKLGTVLLVVGGVVALIAALTCAIGGEIASLMALYNKAPTPLESTWSIIGLLVFPPAGIIHVLCAMEAKRKAGVAP